MPQFLLSEAMRGEGGMLKNIHGLRFMDAYHPARELAPRDVVTRAIFAEMAATGARHVYLDMTHLDDGYIAKRFPRIYSTCKEYGIDITHEPIPVSPAAHYIMGGVKTNLWGATTVPGLFAAGETACTGVHGANRLASNSLLEGLVFGQRAGDAALRYSKQLGSRERENPLPPVRSQKIPPALPEAEIQAIRSSLRKLMWDKVGIIRTKKELLTVLRQLKQWDRALKRPHMDRAVLELKNMVTASTLIAYSALLREGSVGAHFRSDFPKKGKNWKKRTVITSSLE
jgi:L-aspartate oxidase